MDFVTGATGFIGMNLVEALGRKRKLRCLARKASDTLDFLKENNAEIVFGSLEDKKSLEKATKGIGTVFHLAASLGYSDEELRTANVEGTKNLVDACKLNNVKKIVYVSTYLADEKYSSPYGKTKREGEEIVKHSGIPFVIVRPSVVYGPRDERNLGQIIRMVKNLPVVPVISGIKMQPVFVKDVVQALVAASEKKTAVAKTYAIAGPELLSFREIVSGVEKAFGTKKLLLPLPLWLAKLLLPLYSRGLTKTQLEDLSKSTALDTNRAKKDLGIKPISFAEGIKTMLKS